MTTEYDPKYWVELTCPVCGKKFMKKRRLVTENTCCSHACSRVLISRKKRTLENPNGNFRFTQEELIKAMDNPKEKVLRCVCLVCGKEFFISFRNYWEAVTSAKKGIKLAITCSKRCAVSEVDQEEALRKRKESYVKKYGSSENFYSYAKEKSKKTCLEKYGDEYANRNKDVSNTIVLTRRKSYYPKFIEQLSKKRITFITPYDEYVSTIGMDFEYKCEICGTVFKTKETNPQKVICPHCMRMPYSLKEKDIQNYIKSIYSGEIIFNARCVGIFDDRREVDIYIPEKKLAIEFNGNYYHSSKFRDRKEHQQKTIDAKNHGIRLIQIFEYDWDTKQHQIKNIIKGALGIYDHIINGRDCIIKTIESSVYEDFLNLHHLQGAIKSKFRYGLFYNDELISVIGFGASRFKRGEYELHRYCVKEGYRIRGGFSKLLTAFEKDTGITSYTSYVDYSYFDGSGYTSCGFTNVGMTEPNYVWLNKSGIYLNRMSTQKHKLASILGENFDESKTEAENMEANGYLKLYNCGNLIMKK